MTTTAIAPSKHAIATEAHDWASRAHSLKVIDRESCVNASHLLRSIKTLRKGVQDWFLPHLDAASETKRKAEAARKALADERDKMEGPLIEAESVLKRALLSYEAEQERMRVDEERRLQAEAQREAEAVTLAAAAAMEIEAVTTGDAGMLQEARDILEQPIDAPVVSVSANAPKVQGITYKDRWEAHPTINVKELAAAICAGLVPTTFLTPNLSAINQYARATQGTAHVAGVKFWNNRTIAARG